MTDPEEPIEIELDPRKHSRRYELKPESRWLFFGLVPFALLLGYLNGFTSLWTWALLGTGIALGVALVVVWPHIALKKMDD